MNRRRLMKKSSAIELDPVTGRGYVGDYEVVDLGLPSGLLWATCNVGATKETDYGNYYMYGSGSQEYDSSDNYYDGKEVPLASSADTATQVMGSEWRMPTEDELQDLINKTNYTWVTNFNGSGINGGKFTSKTNSNAYVFFPAAGYYYDGRLRYKGGYGNVWSSTPYDSDEAYSLSFSSGGGTVGSNYRGRGVSVRGVTSVGGG